MLDEQMKAKLEQVKASIPEGPRGPKPPKDTDPERNARVLSRPKLMPDPRPEGCPDVASWATGHGNEVLVYTARPWAPPSGTRGLKATEHLWLVGLKGSKLPQVREQVQRADAMLWLETPSAGQPDKAADRAVRVFKQRGGRAVPSAFAANFEFWLVIGWLEV